MNTDIQVQAPSDLTTIQNELDQINEEDQGRAFIPLGIYATIKDDYIKISTQGSTETLQRFDALEGQILYADTNRTYHPDRNNKLPICSSQGGIRGRINYAHPDSGNFTQIEDGQMCASCPFNKFGSGTDEAGTPTKGKACKERRVLLMAVPQFSRPLVVMVPPMSLRSWDEYASQLTLQRPASSYIAHTTKMYVESVSQVGKQYGVAHFVSIGVLPLEQVVDGITARREFKAAFRESIVTENVTTEPPAEEPPF